MFTIRGAIASDLDSLFEVSGHLATVNLPHDRAALASIIARSEQSFAGKLEPAQQALLFVLQDQTTDQETNQTTATHSKVVGCSMVFPQHGSRRAPHVFFDVIHEERYSESLDRLFVHKVLRMGYNYQGLTEIGGLVLQPALRGHPERLGQMLSYVRFAYMAMHRSDFCDETVSELMPPLEPDGRSLLWESLGRRFTGLDYQEADQLSRENKEFIRSLFPQGPIYATLLAPEAQALIGQVGPATKGVEHMLRKIGFRYANRIDPFDGGPHFQARTDDIALVRAVRRLRVEDVSPLPERVPALDGLLAADLPAAPHFRAARGKVALVAGHLIVPPELAATLQVQASDEVGFLPWP